MSLNSGVIVHYHLFKNSGTSLDQLLKYNFGDKWIGYDKNTSGAMISTNELERIIVSNPGKQVFSSHQIVPPIPQLGMTIYPILFLRDPIDRLKSAYLFEWKKQLGLDAPKGTLEEYIKDKFSKRRRNCIEEFQVIRLSNNCRDKIFNHEKMDDIELLDIAKTFIESLSFVGIVDQFDKSVSLLKEYLKPGFPDFKLYDVKSNVLQDISLTQENKRRKIEEELSTEMFESIIERNYLDEALYQFGCAHFKKLCTQFSVLD